MAAHHVASDAALFLSWPGLRKSARLRSGAGGVITRQPARARSLQRMVSDDEIGKLAVGARHPSRRQWNRWANFVVSIRLSVQAFAGLTTRELKRDRASTT